MDSDERRKKMGALVFILVLAVPVLLFIGFVLPAPAEMAMHWTIISILIALLVLMCLWHYIGGEDGKATRWRRNRLPSVILSGFLLCGIGIHLISDRAEDLSITNPSHWLSVIVASFVIIRGVICLLAANEYENTLRRVYALEDEERHLRSEVALLKPKPREKSEEDV